MVEPQPKRLKVSTFQSDEEDSDVIKDGSKPLLVFPRSEIENIHSKLKDKCLCLIDLQDILNTFNLCNSYFSFSPGEKIIQLRHEVLLYLSMLSLFFEVCLKQQSKSLVCERISEVVAAGADNEGEVIDILFEFLASDNKYVSYSAKRVIAALLLILRGSPCQYVLDKLCKNIEDSDNYLELGHSLDVIKTIIEWKDVNEHPLESDVYNPSPTEKCSQITLSPTDTQGTNEVKFIATKQLESRWFTVISRLTDIISSYSLQNEHVIVSFFNLWELLISVKANLSVIETKEFYSGLERLLSILNQDTPVIVWAKIIDLYNEVLCYGSTLALQDVLAEEPCNLAHLIIRSVKDRRFLECVPWRMPAVQSLGGSSGFSANNVSSCRPSSEESNNSFDENSTCMITGNQEATLMHKAVLLVLKAVAVTVKETRCDSSSENSSRSSCSGSEDNDLAIIERSLREVLKRIETFVKSKFPFHPESVMAEWMVRLFSDQDDWLVEAMVCGLDIYTGLGLRISHYTELQSCVNPHKTFASFVDTLHMDHDVLLDLLVSNETCFLLYLLRYLKLLRKTWDLFARECSDRCERVMSVLIRLRLAIDRLVSKNLFPYNINPILRLLEKCEELYEQTPE